MIKINEFLLRVDGQWLHFSRPFQILEAKAVDEVLPMLNEIERQVESNNRYAAGFLSYEAAAAFDPVLHTHDSHLPDNPAAVQEVGSHFSSTQPSEFPLLWFGLYPKPLAVRLPRPKASRDVLEWHPTTGRETYSSAIAQIRKHIANGRTYQVNYTMRLQTDFAGSPWEFFLHLAQNQNNHAAYVDTSRYTICSASPELFFQLDGNKITCRPMKGTTPRGRTTAEDQEKSEWLRHSEKNRAENVMIVDMVRNDLGRIAELGTVSVPRLFEPERYPTLWQMTSTVQANTKASLAEIFAALFPCASITGAPKVSTMKIISELESTPRMVYTGTIGYLAPQRKATFNVAIRTAWIDQESREAEYGVGGGIVWDSTSSDEYAEALLKARVLLDENPPFSLLETILWTPDEGYFLCQKHIARMLDSADYFDIPITLRRLEKYLEQISSEFHGAQRVRVLLAQNGKLNSESYPVEIPEHIRPLKTCLARKPVDSTNIFLFHKTTRREVYESAHQDAEEFDDVLLYNEEGELTEFTIGNLVVELNGQLLTPPIPCGVLPGTFRDHLLETGQVVERLLSVDEVTKFSKVYRVNSIRRWQEVEIQK